MAARAFWTGYLKLSLVTCPVAMTPATSGAGQVRFHTVNRKTGDRVAARYVDAVTGKPVDEDDTVKGYPVGEDAYVTLEDADLDAVRLESTRTIDIERFVDAGSIGWIWYDRPHFLTPADTVGEEAFCVIRDAMAATATAAVSRLVLYGRERAVLLRPEGRGMVLWTLHFGNEVRPEEAYFADLARAPAPSRDAMALIGKLISGQMLDWSDQLVKDPVQDRLLDLIAARKRAARRPRKAPAARAEAAPAAGGNVVDITEALRRSLASEKAPRRGK